MFGRSRHEFVMPPHITPDRPESVTPAHLESDPFSEQLKEPWHEVDTRPIAVKKRAPVLVPDYNRLYGSGRSLNDWRYFLDNYAAGTVTTVANSTVTAAVTLKIPPNARLLQWPGAVHLYFCIRKFAMSPQSAIGTVGSIDVLYNDLIGGQTIPLGDFVSNSNINEDVDVVIPTPVTDPGVTAIANLLVKLTGTTPTVSVYDFQLAFSYVYMLPSLEGYEMDKTHRVLPGKGNDI